MTTVLRKGIKYTKTNTVFVVIVLISRFLKKNFCIILLPFIKSHDVFSFSYIEELILIIIFTFIKIKIYLFERIVHLKNKIF